MQYRVVAVNIEMEDNRMKKEVILGLVEALYHGGKINKETYKAAIKKVKGVGYND